MNEFQSGMSKRMSEVGSLMSDYESLFPFWHTACVLDSSDLYYNVRNGQVCLYRLYF